MDDHLWRRVWADGWSRPNLADDRQPVGMQSFAQDLHFQRRLGVEWEGRSCLLLNAERLDLFEFEDLNFFLRQVRDLDKPSVHGISYLATQAGAFRHYRIEAPIEPLSSDRPPTFIYGSWVHRLNLTPDFLPRLRAPLDWLRLDSMYLGMPVEQAVVMDPDVCKFGFCWNDGLVYQIRGQELCCSGNLIENLAELEHLGRLEKGHTLHHPQFCLRRNQGEFLLSAHPAPSSPQLDDLVWQEPTISRCRLGLTTEQCREILGRPPLRHCRGSLEVWLFEPWPGGEGEVAGAELQLVFEADHLVRLRGTSLEIGGKPFQFKPAGLPALQMQRTLSEFFSGKHFYQCATKSRQPFYQFFAPELGLALWLYSGGRFQWLLISGSPADSGFDPDYP